MIWNIASNFISLPLLPAMTIEPPSTTPLVTPNQPLIVTGTPIDSSEARPGVVHGRPIGRRPSMQVARQISGVIEQRSQGRAGQGFRMLFNFAAGVLLPLYALYVYYEDAILIDGRPAPCDKPIGEWLYVYGMCGLTLGTLGLMNALRMMSVAHIIERAALLEGQEAKDALAPALPTIAATGCVSCCCQLPLAVFIFIWWVKGNFDVWGTTPLTETSPLTDGGCDESLLRGARTVFLITYLTLGVFVVMVCCLCCAAGLFVASNFDLEELQREAEAAEHEGPEAQQARVRAFMARQMDRATMPAAGREGAAMV